MRKTLISTCTAYGRTSLLLGAAVLLCFTSSAFAQYEATAYIPNGTLIGRTTTPGDVSYPYTFDGGFYGSSAVVSFTSSPVASVSYAGTVFNPVGQVVLGGGGIMTYTFEVAAQPFTNVPIDFSGLFSSTTGGDRADTRPTTSFSIQTEGAAVSTYATYQSLFQGDCGAPTCLQFTTFNTDVTFTQPDVSSMQGSFDGTFDMLTGADGRVLGSVQLSAGANINVIGGTASARAFIDPRLEIDAAFLAANPGTTLTITPGVGNELSPVTAVPEPESYALMLAGLAVVGFDVRRRRA